MRRFHNTTAIVGGIIIGVMSFFWYTQQETGPLADIMSSQQAQQGNIVYYIGTDDIRIKNNQINLSGSLTITLVYDPNTVSINTGEIMSPYEYTYTLDPSVIRITIQGKFEPTELITIPVSGDSSNISISSPILTNNNTTTSLSITRSE